MANKTANLGLIKPQEDDFYDIEVFNGNADKIDAAIGDFAGHDHMHDPWDLTGDNFITATSFAMLGLGTNPSIEEICAALWRLNPRYNAFELNPPATVMPAVIAGQTPSILHKRLRIEMHLRLAAEGRFLIRLWGETGTAASIHYWERHYRITTMNTTPTIPAIAASDINWVRVLPAQGGNLNAWSELNLDRDTATLLDALVAVRERGVWHNATFRFNINSAGESERMRVPVVSVAGSLTIERIRTGSHAFLLTYIPATLNVNLNNNVNLPVWVANFRSVVPTEENIASEIRWRRIATANTATSLADIGLTNAATLGEIHTAMRADENRHFETLSIGVTDAMGIWAMMPQAGTAGHFVMERISTVHTRFWLTYYAHLNAHQSTRKFVWSRGNSVDFPTTPHWEEVITERDLNVHDTSESAHNNRFAAIETGLGNITPAGIGAEPARTPVTQAQAEAGTETAVRSWTAQRVRQAINAVVNAGFDAARITGGRLGLARLPTSATANRILRVGTANTDPTFGQVALGTDVSGRLSLVNMATSATGNRVLRVGNANTDPTFGQVQTTDIANNAITAALLANSLVLPGTPTTAAHTNYTSRMLRSTVLSTAAPSGGQNGDIWLRYV